MPVLIAILSVIKYNYFADLGNLHWEGSFSREGCVWLL